MAKSLNLRFDAKLKELKIKGIYERELKRQIPAFEFNEHIKMLNEIQSWSLFILKSFNVTKAQMGHEFWLAVSQAYTESNKRLVIRWAKELSKAIKSI